MTDTKTKILEAAERVILSEGPDGATIRKITEEAGVNVASVNYHFGSKEDLARAMLGKFVGPIQAERRRMISEARKNTGDASLSLETIIRCMFEPLIDLRKEGGRTHEVLAGIRRLFGDESMMKGTMGELVGPIALVFRRELHLAMPDSDEMFVDFFLAHMMTMTPQLLNNTIGKIMGLTGGQEIRFEDIIEMLIRFMEGGAKNLMCQTPDFGTRRNNND